MLKFIYIFYIYIKNVFVAILSLLGMLLFYKGCSNLIDKYILIQNNVFIQVGCICIGLFIILYTNSIFNQSGIIINQSEFKDILDCMKDIKRTNNENEKI